MTAVKVYACGMGSDLDDMGEWHLDSRVYLTREVAQKRADRLTYDTGEWREWAYVIELEAQWPEPVCHDDVDRAPYFRCSRCGALMRLDDGGLPVLEIDGVADVPRYCPGCGAKVIR